MNDNEIMVTNIMMDRRGRSDLARDWSIRRTHDKYPELKEIDQDIKVCKAEMLMDMIEHHGIAGDSNRTQLTGLERKKKLYLHEHTIDPNYDQIIPVCSICGDSGLVEGVPCKCFRELMIPALAAASGLDQYPSIQFSAFTSEFFSNPEKMKTLRAISEAYVRGFPGQKANLLFCGKPGTGKTYMAVCIAKAVIQKTIPVLFIRITELLSLMSEYRMLMNSFSPDVKRLRAITDKREMILQGAFLVIDELGIEVRTANVAPDLLEIFGSRQQQNLPTVITTNLSLAELRGIYDDRICSRLLGDFKALPFEGHDIRMSSKYHQ